MANDPDIAITQFLIESNAIEGVFDEQSLEDAQEAWDYLMSEDVLHSGVVLHTHKLLMKHQGLDKNELGMWRKRPVYIGGKEAMQYGFIPSAMGHWEFEAMRKSPKVDAKKLHVEYEAIHPFIDGNGRTGRMFMNWIRLKRNQEPLLIIYESNKYAYYEWFN